MTALTERQCRSGPHDWRVLEGGDGPILVFLHGAGGSTESFRPLMEHLASDFRVFAMDLPGHGATRRGARGRSGLGPMAEDLADLITAEAGARLALVGHSAGGALALQMDGMLTPRTHILINAALAPFDGVAGWAFPLMARTLRNLPFAPDLIARRVGNERQITGLLETTGSAVSEEMITRYAALAASRDHVDGTLAMMAEWDLADLLARLPEIATPARFIVGLADRTVLPGVSEHAVGRMPDAKLVEHPGGHLLHEEAPELIASEVTAILAEKPQEALS